MERHVLIWQRVQSLKKKFYFHFQDYVDLIIWKVNYVFMLLKSVSSVYIWWRKAPNFCSYSWCPGSVFGSTSSAYQIWQCRWWGKLSIIHTRSMLNQTDLVIFRFTIRMIRFMMLVDNSGRKKCWPSSSFLRRV